jgi:hypothetical protein
MDQGVIYREGIHPFVKSLREKRALFSSLAQSTSVPQTKTDDDEDDDDDALLPTVDVVFVHGLRGHPFGIIYIYI